MIDRYPLPAHNTRLGFQYFPDTLHYREADLKIWLPKTKALGATWLTLLAPADRSIPEHFLNGLLSARIEPVLRFYLPNQSCQPLNDLGLLFETYARWGVHYVVLFDRPNLRAAWPASAWAQTCLVEQFLDIYLPIAEMALQAGLLPVFPPLEPGGDYWDTAFLRAALQGLLRRGSQALLEHLIFGAYAWSGNRALDWGAGGPERWPAAQPYYTPVGYQDQRGFHIFDWYLALVRAALGDGRPMLLLGMGARLGDQPDPMQPAITTSSHCQQNLAIATELLNDCASPDTIPPEVLAGNFWLLSAASNSPAMAQAWFPPGQAPLPIVDALRQKIAGMYSGQCNLAHPTRSQAKAAISGPRMIAHYLLLPSYETGVADWPLEIVQSAFKKRCVTIGFSIPEALHAARVTIVGKPPCFPESLTEQLSSNGCQVEWIDGTGTEIASQLASL